MKYRDIETGSRTYDNEISFSRSFNVLMRSVYLWMTLALVITGFTAYGVATTPSLIYPIVTNRVILLGLIVAELALVISVSAAINRLSLSVATLLFTLYAILNGATLSVIFLVYTLTSIQNVFFIAAGTFLVSALIGSFTKRDLSAFGRVLIFLLVGLIIATLANMFFKLSGLDMVLNYLGVFIFTGLTIYDSQKIKRMLLYAEGSEEIAKKIALLGALSLYLDFINLFLYLLRIFGKRN